MIFLNIVRLLFYTVWYLKYGWMSEWIGKMPDLKEATQLVVGELEQMYVKVHPGAEIEEQEHQGWTSRDNEKNQEGFWNTQKGVDGKL